MNDVYRIVNAIHDADYRVFIPALGATLFTGTPPNDIQDLYIEMYSVFRKDVLNRLLTAASPLTNPAQISNIFENYRLIKTRKPELVSNDFLWQLERLLDVSRRALNIRQESEPAARESTVKDVLIARRIMMAQGGNFIKEGQPGFGKFVTLSADGTGAEIQIISILKKLHEMEPDVFSEKINFWESHKPAWMYGNDSDIRNSLSLIKAEVSNILQNNNWGKLDTYEAVLFYERSAVINRAVTGNSWMLAQALSLLSIATHTALPEGVVCTGEIIAGGKIIGVNNVGAKLKFVATQGCSYFVCPADNRLEAENAISALSVTSESGKAGSGNIKLLTPANLSELVELFANEGVNFFPKLTIPIREELFFWTGFSVFLGRSQQKQEISWQEGIQNEMYRKVLRISLFLFMLTFGVQLYSFFVLQYARPGFEVTNNILTILFTLLFGAAMSLSYSIIPVLTERTTIERIFYPLLIILGYFLAVYITAYYIMIPDQFSSKTFLAPRTTGTPLVDFFAKCFVFLGYFTLHPLFIGGGLYEERYLEYKRFGVYKNESLIKWYIPKRGVFPHWNSLFFIVGCIIVIIMVLMDFVWFNSIKPSMNSKPVQIFGFSKDILFIVIFIANEYARILGDASVTVKQ